MDKTEIEKMIRRRVAGGWNEAESRARLSDLLTDSPNVIAYGLVYEGFATEKQALRIVADL